MKPNYMGYMGDDRSETFRFTLIGPSSPWTSAVYHQSMKHSLPHTETSFSVFFVQHKT